MIWVRVTHIRARNMQMLILKPAVAAIYANSQHHHRFSSSVSSHKLAKGHTYFLGNWNVCWWDIDDMLPGTYVQYKWAHERQQYWFLLPILNALEYQGTVQTEEYLNANSEQTIIVLMCEVEMIWPYQSSYSKPIIHSEALHHGCPNIASQSYKDPRQC